MELFRGDDVVSLDLKSVQCMWSSEEIWKIEKVDQEMLIRSQESRMFGFRVLQRLHRNCCACMVIKPLCVTLRLKQCTP
jgi:hypothetical protein